VGLVIAQTANQSNKIDFRRDIWLSVADQVTAKPGERAMNRVRIQDGSRQQDIDESKEFPGWPSWTRIEPCASFLRQISVAFLKVPRD